jgi:Flp pilus assembly protein TadD
MIARAIFAVIFLWTLLQMGAAAQEAMVPSFSGELFADGRPVDRLIEVRLEAQDSSLIANAYTFGSSRFTFSDVTLRLDTNYFLVIKEYGFKELRYRLHLEDFVKDSSRPGIYHFRGFIILDLESLPPGKKAGEERITGPKAVDARQLKATISDEAQREYNLALEDAAAGDGKATLKHLEKAVELAPEYYDALNKLGVEYIKAGQYRKAEAILDRACALNPNDPLPLTNLGTLHFQEGESGALAVAGQADADAIEASYRKAVDVFERALRLSPLDPRINFYLGTALYKIGAYERAESLLDNALTLDGRMHEARLALVNIYVRQRRYEEALRQISAYLEANPDSPQREELKALRIKIETGRIGGQNGD